MISCSVRGVFSSVFCDFGAEFTIFDDNGEEPIECFIANITKVGCSNVVIQNCIVYSHRLAWLRVKNPNLNMF